MAIKRKPLQGIANIIRFNWHFYLAALLGMAFIGLASYYLPTPFHYVALSVCLLVFIPLAISLLVSFYVYDVSGLYNLSWLPNLHLKTILNINAGFDETSQIIQHKFEHVQLTIGDFYDERHHTELSIKRARKALPPIAGTVRISTSQIPFSNCSFDYVIAILSAHEIRNHDERVLFFKELNRVLKPEGHIYVTEHLRDWKNFLAYSIGSFHFHAKKVWLQTFVHSNLKVVQEIKINPFITTFVLVPHGNTV
ncbi:MAG TPA: methyltransferase domain-containing protein [Phnomibacter sp.]|nr:methyltransferase domain-containing protein [Phnomibacter sp.]